MNPRSFKSLFSWLEAECLEAEWRLKRLVPGFWIYVGTLDETGTLEVERPDQPEDMAPSHAMRYVVNVSTAPECILLGRSKSLPGLTDAMPRSGVFHIPTDDAKAILKAGRDHDDEGVRKNAEHAQDNLLKRGYFSVMD